LEESEETKGRRRGELRRALRTGKPVKVNLLFIGVTYLSTPIT